MLPRRMITRTLYCLTRIPPPEAHEPALRQLALFLERLAARIRPPRPALASSGGRRRRR